MRKWVSAFICKHGTRLCTLALAVSTVSVSFCRGMYYQPKEPDNLEEFVRNHNTNKRWGVIGTCYDEKGASCIIKNVDVEN